ncbi:MAG: DUF1802 family protein [Cyanosarcina radialis HA8281-LM2]|jgi:hypothetical protein|nr:DUF1802 family protein [Cyanosarcina radialis HA8281-LM2]
MIDTALCLPAPEIEGLIQGRTIVAISHLFIDPGEFALYASDTSINILPINEYYRSSFLSTAQATLARLNPNKPIIKAWAKCELCEIIDKSKPLKDLSLLTVWTTEALQKIIKQREYIFLAYMHVYKLPQPLQVSILGDIGNQFVPFLPTLSAAEGTPILSNNTFKKRLKQLKDRLPPLHPELEELQGTISSLAITNLDAKKLERDIQVFLGWSGEHIQQPEPVLTWINDIAKLGDRSKEEDEGKSNYQAGTDFENIVRKSLDFLGFTVDSYHKGGAGGVDVFCSKPYPLIGECKSGKKIPNDTAVQLLNLGTLRLNKKDFQQSTKLIIGPGEPTQQLLDAATIHNMAIINSETLEKLVKLQNNYRNSVDLFKLKEYLKAGKSDEDVTKYIEQVSQDIRLRSHVIQVLKNYLENTHKECAGVEAIHGAYSISNFPKRLSSIELNEILIELSSPLAGYLGRKKGEDWRRDRFYFLRDLLM